MDAYLQKGDITNAEQQLNYLRGIKNTSAKNLKVAYAYAAMPARYLLENRKWKDAALLKAYPADFPWNKFPWQQAITVYTRLLGKVHTNDLPGAKHELTQLEQLRQQLLNMKDSYKARQVEVQIKSGMAWIAFREDDGPKAEALMREAAEMEDGIMKHPVTPGEVLPARELLADMLIELKKPNLALAEYRQDIARHAGRLNGIKGMQVAEQLAKK